VHASLFARRHPSGEEHGDAVGSTLRVYSQGAALPTTVGANEHSKRAAMTALAVHWGHAELEPRRSLN
jgi:hypothetical protein